MEVLTINSPAFLNKCVELKHQIKVKPDIIVGILDGAGYLIDNLKKEDDYKSVVFKLVRLQRKNELIKRISFFKTLLKLLPYKISNRLRIYESIRAKKRINNIDLVELSKKNIDFEMPPISKESIKNILVVDDAIDTGRTMFIIKNNLSNMFPDSNIKVAVISWTIDTSIVKPDYYLFKNVLVRFPWSKDYKGKGGE